jgi:Fic family protein
MKEIPFQIVPADLLNDYKKYFPKTVHESFENLQDSDLSIKSFSFYTSVSAVFSSKIEGEEIELDSYLKHKMLGVKFLPDYTRKIDDLYAAYLFAEQNELNEANVSKVHAIITRHILQKQQRGETRNGMMYVMTPDGRIEYVACAPAAVRGEMRKFYGDLEKLLIASLSFEETLFFAAMVHLVFVKIHPFDDGNGRTSRLLEKWFLAQKLGQKAWYMQSERFYYANHAIYYKNIRLLGLEYDLLDYTQALPFLKMLPESLLKEVK